MVKDAVCMKCHLPGLLPFKDRHDVDYFACPHCGHVEDRVMATGGIHIEWLAPWQPKHHSVGALILRGNEFLVIERRVWPYKHGVPAGHVDEGESPIDAVVREVSEELGAHVRNASVVAHEDHLLGDRCRKGADVHKWTLFECEVDTDEVWNASDEASKLMWLSHTDASRLEFAFASGHMLRSIGKID